MLRKRKQYGGQEQIEQSIEELQSQVAQLRSELDQKRTAAEQASKNYQNASDILRTATAEKAKIDENASIKIQAATNANALTSTVEKRVKNAQTAKQTANTEYTTAISSKTNVETRLGAAKKTYNNASQAEADSKAKANAAQIEVAKVQSTVNSLTAEIDTVQKTVKEKVDSLKLIESTEAKAYDPSILDGLRGWFDANQLQGAEQSLVTTWDSSKTLNTISSPPKFTGQGTIKLWNGMKVLGVSSTQTLTLTPTLQLAEFTLFLVCRHSGANKNAIFQGSAASNTFFGHFTNKKNFFSIGNFHNNGTAPPADTNWDILRFSRDSAKKAVFSSNGKQIVEYANTNAGFDGLSVNTGTQKSDAEIAEVVLFEKSLTPDEIQKMEGLLARKWGLIGSLDSAHPYKGSYPDLMGVLSGGRKKRRVRKLKRKTKKVRKGKKRSTRRR